MHLPRGVAKLLDVWRLVDQTQVIGRPTLAD